MNADEASQDATLVTFIDIILFAVLSDIIYTKCQDQLIKLVIIYCVLDG